MWEFKIPKQGSKVDANLAQHPQKFEMEYPQDEEKKSSNCGTYYFHNMSGYFHIKSSLKQTKLCNK